MKKASFKNIFIFMAAFFLGCNACQTTGQPASDPQIQDEPEPPHPILGGFQHLALDSALAQEAFVFIKKSLSHLMPSYIVKSIKNAEYQVVAGFKIRLLLELESSEGKKSELQALIFKDLSGDYELLDYHYIE